MYNNPAVMLTEDVAYPGLDKDTLQKHFEDFYEEVYEEVSKFGEIEEMNVCDNLSAHLVGNVYVKFVREDDATSCVNALNGRFYATRPIQAEFSPVTDFREASCRQYETGKCTHGGYCNFMHLKELPRELRKRLFGSASKGGQRKYHDHDRSPPRGDDRFPPRGGGGGGGRYRRSPPRGDDFRDRGRRRERSRSPPYGGGGPDSYRGSGGGGGGGYGGPDRGRDGGRGDRYNPYGRQEPQRDRDRERYQ